MLEQISFPALLVKGSVLEWGKSEQQLRICTPAALKNGWFNGLRVLDSAGRQFKVTTATFLRKNGKKAFRGFFAPELIEVELFLEGAPETISLDTLKRYVTKALKRDQGFWESSGQDINILLASIDSAQDVPSVWQALSPFLKHPHEDL